MTDRDYEPTAERSLVKNAASARQVKNAEKVEKRRARQRVDDLVAVLETPQGRRVFARLIFDDFGLLRTSLGSDPYMTHVNIGRRESAAHLYTEIKALRPAILAEMMTDHAAAEAELVAAAQSQRPADAPETEDES